MGDVDCGHPPSEDHPLRHLLPFRLAREARQHGRVVTPTETTDIPCSTRILRSTTNRGYTTTVHPATEIWGSGLWSSTLRRSSSSSSAAFPPHPRGQATRASRDPDRDDWHRVFDEDPSIPSQPGPHDDSPPSDRRSSSSSSAAFPPRPRGQATRASRDPDRDDWHRVFDEDPSIPSQPGPHDDSPPRDRNMGKWTVVTRHQTIIPFFNYCLSFSPARSGNTEIWGSGLSSPAIRRSSPSSSAAFPPRPRGQATRASRDPDRDDWHRVFDEDPSIPSQPGPHDHSPPSDRFLSLSWRVNKMTMKSPCHDTPRIRTCHLPTRECCGS
ncbi:hypothetical protein MRX96_014706 [Rhipicephalus microplus]